MSINELAEAFRANQISVSTTKLGQFICDGKFPFAVGDNSSGRATYLIFRKAFYKWLGEQIQTQPIIYGDYE